MDVRSGALPCGGSLPARSPRCTALGLCLAIAAVAVSPEATAREDADPYTVKLRLAPPFHQVIFVNPMGRGEAKRIGLVGGSVGVEFHELITAELGGGTLPFCCGPHHELFLRGGIAPVILDTRRAARGGWTLQLDALAGYRLVYRAETRDGHDGSETTHGLRANAGLEVARRPERGADENIASSPGVTLRLLSGVTLPIVQRRADNWADREYYFTADDDLRWALDFAFDVGLAF